MCSSSSLAACHQAGTCHQTQKITRRATRCSSSQPLLGLEPSRTPNPSLSPSPSPEPNPEPYPGAAAGCDHGGEEAQAEERAGAPLGSGLGSGRESPLARRPHLLALSPSLASPCNPSLSLAPNPHQASLLEEGVGRYAGELTSGDVSQARQCTMLGILMSHDPFHPPYNLHPSRLRSCLRRGGHAPTEPAALSAAQPREGRRARTSERRKVRVVMPRPRRPRLWRRPRRRRMRSSRSGSRASSLACRSSTCSSRAQRSRARARGGANGADTGEAHYLGKGGGR